MANSQYLYNDTIKLVPVFGVCLMQCGTKVFYSVVSDSGTEQKTFHFDTEAAFYQNL